MSSSTPGRKVTLSTKRTTERGGGEGRNDSIHKEEIEHEGEGVREAAMETTDDWTMIEQRSHRAPWLREMEEEEEER